MFHGASAFDQDIGWCVDDHASAFNQLGWVRGDDDGEQDIGVHSVRGPRPAWTS